MTIEDRVIIFLLYSLGIMLEKSGRVCKKVGVAGTVNFPVGNYVPHLAHFLQHEILVVT